MPLKGLTAIPQTSKQINNVTFDLFLIFGLAVTIIGFAQPDMNKSTIKRNEEVTSCISKTSDPNNKVYLVEGKDAHNCEFISLTKLVVSTFSGHKHSEELNKKAQQ